MNIRQFQSHAKRIYIFFFFFAVTGHCNAERRFLAVI